MIAIMRMLQTKKYNYITKKYIVTFIKIIIAALTSIP